MNKEDYIELQYGAIAWNEHRSKNSATRKIDLSRADLRDQDLRGYDLRGVVLTSSRLERANLEGVELFEANLRGAFLAEANLNGANLTGANLTNTKLQDALMIDANLTAANLKRAQLMGSNLHGATLTKANLVDANLADTNLTEAILVLADLSGANLGNAMTRGANLEGALVSASTIDVQGLPLTARLSFQPDPAALPEGNTRLKVELPANISPQAFAQLTSAAQALAELAEEFGERLEQHWFDHETDSRRVDITTEDSNRSFSIALNRVHYGSPFLMDLVEILRFAGIAAAGVGSIPAALAVTPGGRAVLSVALTLVTPEGRRIFKERIIAEQQERLDKTRASSAGHRRSIRQADADYPSVTLTLEPSRLDEVDSNVHDALPNLPDIRDAIGQRLNELIPLLEQGFEITPAPETEIESEDEG